VALCALLLVAAGTSCGKKAVKRVAPAEKPAPARKPAAPAKRTVKPAEKPEKPPAERGYGWLVYATRGSRDAPDGKGAELFAVDVSGTPRRIGALPVPAGEHDQFEIVATAPGDRLVALTHGGDLFVAGFEPPRLARVTAMGKLLADSREGYEAELLDVAFRPDGGYLLFRIRGGISDEEPYVDPPTPPGHDAGWYLYVRATGKRVTLDAGEHGGRLVGWSPDGKMLIFISELTGGTTLGRVAIDGKQRGWSAKVKAPDLDAKWLVGADEVWAMQKTGLSSWDWRDPKGAERGYAVGHDAQQLWQGLVHKLAATTRVAEPDRSRVPRPAEVPEAAGCKPHHCRMVRLGEHTHVLENDGVLTLVRRGKLGAVIARGVSGYDAVLKPAGAP